MSGQPAGPEFQQKQRKHLPVPQNNWKQAAQKSAEKCIWNTREKLEECSTQCEMAYLSMIKYDLKKKKKSIWD